MIVEHQYKLEKDPVYGFFRVVPCPSSKELQEYYSREFYSAQYSNCNDSSIEIQEKDKEFYQGHFEDICCAIEETSRRPSTGLRVLDIGCGWGQALLHFRKRGMQCVGLDPAPEAVRYARAQGLEVYESNMGDVSILNERKFDVVCLLNVLEHLPDPGLVLETIHGKLLAEGGLLIVEVPNEFNAFQVCADEEFQLAQWWVAPPAHLNYFTVDTLTSFMEGHGFSVRLKEASFPMEMFLLFGENYVKKNRRGRTCHKKRMNFEHHLRSTGRTDVLRRFYRSLAEQNLGRQIFVVAERRPLFVRARRPPIQ
ncbi:MAG: class I SAM-dependent methyltransferase [Elusimicrobia bacterium]|nr:class I SAM-dependent methyltransferase [Elusimicrobiota bacterium]